MHLAFILYVMSAECTAIATFVASTARQIGREESSRYFDSVLYP